MQHNRLGDSDLLVSELCLGTMTYGQQNTVQDAHHQLDWAIAHGINFIDTAEMYPVPARAETQGLTEDFIGQWMVNQQRDRLIVATKIAGPSRGMKWIRDFPLAIDRPNIISAVEASLKRLQTDYIDLYQIHWPDRYVPLFGQSVFDPTHERKTVAIEDQLAVFAELIQAGKIRYLGLSNETPWGIGEFCRMADHMGLPKVVTVQNAYNLLNRVFDWGLAETCYRHQVSLLAYSPLGFGSLTGKYLKNAAEQSQQPSSEQGRLQLFSGFGSRYLKVNVDEAVAAYCEIARRYSMTPAQLAIAFVQSRWFVGSTIIGATTLSQLEENVSAVEITLSPEVLAEIDAVHTRFPNPAP